MNRPILSRLTRTDLDMAEADGRLVREGGIVWVHRPNNPGFYWGNYALLPGPPEADELEALIGAARAHFADAPDVHHVLLKWDGPDVSKATAQAARALGMTTDGGLEMVAHALHSPQASSVVARPLDMARDWAQIVSLNIACDPAEQTGSPDYLQFKDRIRASWLTLHQAGMATWWGAFVGDKLVGQCGMVRCSDKLGRFQAVETHPEHRRQGACSTVVVAAGTDALGPGGCEAVILGVDPVGPALAVYERLGFAPGGMQRVLLLGGEPLRVRSEQPGDFAEVRTVTTAAFGQPEEAALIAALRGTPGVISLVAERSSTLLGHALFSPVSGEGPGGTARQGIALGPVAVRPEQQRLGVGTALIREGLERCRAAGWTAAFVLGDPAYYSRFGWQPAAQWELRCQWEVPPTAFQAMALVPEGLSGWRGLVRYHPEFDDLG